MKTTVRVSTKAFTNKQEAVDCTGGFKNGSAARDMKLTIQELAERWLAGYSILPAKMKRGGKSEAANWVSQQIFAVDFDNENGDKERVSDDYYVTPAEAQEMARRAGLFPAIIYSSFSSTAEHVKFRMIFVLDEDVTTKQLHAEVTTKLYSAFMKGGYIAADTRCSDLSRLYYGGRELLYQDYTAVTEISHIQMLGSTDVPSISRLRSKRDGQGSRMNDYIPVSMMHTTEVRGLTTSAMTALINGDPHQLREILHNRPDSTKQKKENTCTVCANMDPYRMMKQLPLHHILDVPLSTAFRCIMHGHEDLRPSANVQQLKDGTYAYFCHGCYGEGNGKTLIDLIMEATGCRIGETVEFTEIALSIRLHTEHQLKCRRRCHNILDFILSPAFRTGIWEPLYRFMTRRKLLSHYRYYLEQAVLYSASEPLVGEGIPTFYESVRETSARMGDFAARILIIQPMPKLRTIRRRAEIFIIRNSSSSQN